MIFLTRMFLNFIVKHSINLIWILLILVAGSALIHAYDKYKDLYAEFQLVKEVPSLATDVAGKIEGYKNIHEEFSELMDHADDNKLRELIPTIEEKTKKVRDRKTDLEKKQEKEGTFEENLNNPFKVNKLPECLITDLELELISGIIKYSDKATDYIENKSSYTKRLEFFNEQYASVLSEYNKDKNEYEELTTYSFGKCQLLILPDERNRCYELKDKLEILKNNLNYILDQKEILQSKLSILKEPIYEAHFKNQPYIIWLEELQTRYEIAEKTLKDNFLYKIIHETKKYLPKALAILLGIIFAPVIVKAIFYYIFSPLASLLKPVKIVPGESGELILEEKKGSVSVDVLVDKEHELLVHSDYLQSSSTQGKKDTSWFLNKRYPFTCIAAQMVALTRIRTDKEEVFVVSANEDASSEIGAISVPTGAVVVLQPHNLVGVVQSIDSQVRISSHWRFSSLHAWLTLQLRYLAIHGPCKLIVQGCRGVRCEPVGEGRSINQASTIGFSAGLDYSTRRCDTFIAYLFGKRELLNDTFKGKGYCIYQETPSASKGSLLFGRGLQGLVDSLLKVFGV